MSTVEAALQEVFPVHLHVFPRNDGGGFGPARYLQKPEIAEEITHELEMSEIGITQGIVFRGNAII